MHGGINLVFYTKHFFDTVVGVKEPLIILPKW